MIFAIMLGLAVGIALAQFFRAYVLIPATVVALAGILLYESARGHAAVHALLASLSVALALQSGFFVGAFLNGIGLYGKAPHLILRSSRRHQR